MSTPTPPKFRHAFRRTDTKDPAAAHLKLVEEPIELSARSVLIKVHAVALNYRDANMIFGSNPWPILPNGIPCSDAVGTIIAAGSAVTMLKVGDRVTPILDQAMITGKEQDRVWLAADVDGLLADYLVVEQELVVKVPQYLTHEEACLMPCAGITAWSALKGVHMGSSVLVQGTGGVSMMALKLARAAGCKVILSSSSDTKLAQISSAYPNPPLLTFNYAKNPNWHDEVFKLNNGIGVDLVIENGGTSSLVRSMKAAKRNGMISQVGYLGEQNSSDFGEMLSILIDKKICLRGIDAGSKHDLEDLFTAVEAIGMSFEDIIDKVFRFEDAEEAIKYVWDGRQVGKVVIKISDE